MQKRMLLLMAAMACTLSVCQAAEVWTLDNSAAMPGSFWTITSPDGKWKLTCVPSNGRSVEYDGEGEADLVVTGYYYDGQRDRDVEAGNVFASADGDCCVLKGSGVLRLPTHARDKSGVSHTVEIGHWTLGGLHAPVRKMTKCVVPADYTAAIGDGSAIACNFEVESGNPKYYAKDGVLYMKERYRDDGLVGDVLLQCPTCKKGTFTIPDVVTKVRSCAFEDCNLSELVIGPNLEIIEDGSEVGDTLKKITIRDNPRFRCSNGILMGDAGKTLVLALRGVLNGKTNMIPPSVDYLPGYSMAYLSGVKSLVFSSDKLTIAGEAFEGSGINCLDFSAVGELHLSRKCFEDLGEDSEMKVSIRLPENVVFGYPGLCFDEDDNVSDIYWLTDKSYDECAIHYYRGPDDEYGDWSDFYIQTPHRIKLHLLKTAGDWSEFYCKNVTVVKDLVPPAEVEVPAFFNAGTRVGVAVSGTLQVADYASLKVTGLPSGIKVTYDKKGGATFSGAATKDGTYSVVVSYLENGTTVARTYSLFVDKAPHLVLTLVAGDGGTVKGGGDVYAGKKAPIAATAAKGYVFSGWYQDAALDTPYMATSVDFRSPKLEVLNTSPVDSELTLHAKFISISEDWASVNCTIADEYATNAAIEPITIAADGGSLPTVKVTGSLPTGLKFTATRVVDKKSGKVIADANMVYGTPTKSGIYTATVTATTAGKKTAVTNVVFTVLNRAKGERVLKVVCDTSMGKASGGGIRVSGKTVTLTATPRAAVKATKKTAAVPGTVFAGWYADSEFMVPLAGTADYRTKTFGYVMPDGDTTVYARFVDLPDDQDITLFVDGREITTDAADVLFQANDKLPLDVSMASGSLPTVTMENLPPGLKYTAKLVVTKTTKTVGKKKVTTVVTNALPNTIYGTPTKPGTYVVTAKLSNAAVSAKNPLVRSFTMVVDNFTAANDLVSVYDRDGNPTTLANARGEQYEIPVGVMEFDLPTIVGNGSGTVKVTGLPPGLKHNATTGKITGAATTAGTYTAYVTVGKTVSTFTVVAKPLPAWATGTFVGLIRQVDYNSHGEVIWDEKDWEPHDWYDILTTVTVASSGKVTVNAKFPEGQTFKLTFSAINNISDGCYVIEGDSECAYDSAKSFKLHGRYVISPVGLRDEGEVTLGRVSVEMKELATKVGKKWQDVWADDEQCTFSTDEDRPLLQNLWSREDVGQLPSLVGRTQTLSYEGHTLTFAFGNRGAISVKDKAPNGKTYSTSAVLSLREYRDGIWFGEICVNVIYKKNSSGSTAVFDVVIDGDETTVQQR